MNSFQKELAKRKEHHLLRTLRIPEKGIDFYSNDYLGLAHSERLHDQISMAYTTLSDPRNGATGSRLLSGNSGLAEKVEQKVAAFHEAEAALIYNSGYTANLGLISCLAKKDVTLFMDELLHASLIDGARLGLAQRIKFKHNDVEDLKNKLSRGSGEKLVIIESIYSMDGDVAPLKEILDVCQTHDAGLIVDEAHAIGVFGNAGEGLSQSLGIHNHLFARILTYGKAPGTHGAAVVGPAWLRDYQINFSRSFIFSTAPPDHTFIAISCMYDMLQEVKSERDSLNEVVNYFIEMRSDNPNWLDSPSHIQSLIIPGNEAVIMASNFLKQHGIIALPIRKPSVPEGQERIRFCLHSHNTIEEVNHLFRTLNQWEKESS